MIRSASGITPPVKSYFDLPLQFKKEKCLLEWVINHLFSDVRYAFCYGSS
jgi:hypothetical protein